MLPALTIIALLSETASQHREGAEWLLDKVDEGVTEVLLEISMYNEAGAPLRPPLPPTTESPPAPTLPRYAIGGVHIGNHTIRAQMDAGNPGVSLLMAKCCLGCSDKCPAQVPGCAGANFCAPSYPHDYVPTSEFYATGVGCGHGHDAGMLDGQSVCTACFGGHSHSRFYTMARANASLAAQPQSLAVPNLSFGALVRTTPWMDRLWSNVGIGFRSDFLSQVNASVLWFSLRLPPARSLIGLRPALARYESLPAAKFTTGPGNRYLSATLEVGSGGTVCGPALLDYLFDVSSTTFKHMLLLFYLAHDFLCANSGRHHIVQTGNAGISIESEVMATALEKATGGIWNRTGNDNGNLWIDRSLHPPTTLTFVLPPMVARAQQIRVTLPASIWAPFADTGQTVFERYDKNVLGLPFIMAGDFFFDDGSMTLWYGQRGVG